MEELRCPICGTINLPGRETCNICQALLKPENHIPLEKTSPPFVDIPEDWMQDLRDQRTPDDAGVSELSGDESTQEKLYPQREETTDQDWLSRLRSHIEPVSSPEKDIPVPAFESGTVDDIQKEEEVPDWLKSILSVDKEEKPPDKLFVTSREEIKQEPEIHEEPDWLLRIRYLRQLEESKLLESLPSQGGTTVGEQQEQPLLEKRPPFQMDEEITPSKLSPEQTHEQIPCQPFIIDQSPVEVSETFDGKYPEEEFLEEKSAIDVDQYRTEITLTEGQEVSGIEPLSEDIVEDVSSLDLEHMPEWLKQAIPEEGLDLAVSADQEEKKELDTTPIPLWLESVRPVESVVLPIAVKDETIDKQESSGPLAGLRGILQSGPEVPLTQLPAYSLELQVTDAQRNRVDLLKKMLTRKEFHPMAAETKVEFSMRWILWAVLLVILLATLTPMITSVQWFQLPVAPLEVSITNRLITELPVNQAVLVGFDYAPSLSGEIEKSAMIVVSQLIERQSSLTLVSTSPAGALLAERFISKLQAMSGATGNIRYVNLGFIPGGASGLLSFVENMPRTSPYTITGVPAWGADGFPLTPVLHGVNAITDYSLVLVISDNALTARDWIEQVKPRLSRDGNQIPMLMVTSAQAAPMIRPYFEAIPRQVDGLIAGWSGGAAYARWVEMDKTPGFQWDAFSSGILAAVGLIIIGGLLGIYSKFIPGATTIRSKK